MEARLDAPGAGTAEERLRIESGKEEIACH